MSVMLAIIATACSRTPTTVDRGLRFCDAVCVADDTILITNFGSTRLNPVTRSDSSGYIMQLTGDDLSTWYPADGTMSAPKGMALTSGYLYVADVCKVHAINRRSHRKTVIPLPPGSDLANHMTVVGDMLLLSVTGNGNILALDLRADGSPSQSGFQLLTTVPGANGLCYAGGRLFIASCNPTGNPTGENVIYVIDDFTNPQARPFISRSGQYDGLTEYKGRLYFTDWNGGSVGHVALADTTDIKLLDIRPATQLAGPAKLAVYKDRLYIPDLPNSRVIIY